jgi:hypothetical protein
LRREWSCVRHDKCCQWPIRSSDSKGISNIIPAKSATSEIFHIFAVTFPRIFRMSGGLKSVFRSILRDAGFLNQGARNLPAEGAALQP